MLHYTLGDCTASNISASCIPQETVAVILPAQRESQEPAFAWDSSVSFIQSEDQKLALDIMKEHSRNELAPDLHTTNVETWARASFQLAKKFAYGPLHENSAPPPTPTKTYLKNAEKVGRRQAALAGYRLSDRLRQILG